MLVYTLIKGQIFQQIAEFAFRYYYRKGPDTISIPFAPHAFVLAVSGGTQKPAYAIGVPNDINAFHYYTVCSSFLFAPLVLQFQKTVSQLS